MASNDAQLGDRTPDFVLAILARRYTRAALMLTLPAAILAVLSISLPMLVMVAFAGLEAFFLLGVVLATASVVVLWRFIRKRRRQPTEARAEPPLRPRDLEGLLELGDFLIGELERGDDRGFEWYLHYFVGALDRLTPDVRAELLRRGLDLTRLRVSLYTPTDMPREPSRALYRELQRFVTVARQPNRTEPYRSAEDDGSDLQSSEESAVEVEIRRTLRSRLVGIGALVVLIWTAMPWVYFRASGGDEFVREDALILALVATPVVLLVAAYFTKQAAEHSWTAAHRGRPPGANSIMPWLVAATRLSLIPVLGWTSYVTTTSMDIPSRELEWKVWIIGLLAFAPVVALALLIRRGNNGRF
jgi:hypothetical protein